MKPSFHFIRRAITCLSVAVVMLAGETRAVQNATGRIEGTVKREGSGDPLAGCPVNLGAFNGTEMVQRSGTTDSSGRFVVDQLPAGNYSIIVSCPGITYVRPPGGGGPASILVGPRQQVSGVAITLRPVEGIISGRILDNQGRPMAGIRVIIDPVIYESGRIRAAGYTEVKTNDRGEYRFFSVSPGRYYVRTVFNSPGDTHADTYYPGVTALEKALQVVVKRGSEVIGIDFTNQTLGPVTISGQIQLPAALKGVDASPIEFFLLRSDNFSTGRMPLYPISMDNDTGNFALGRFRSGAAPIAPGLYYVFAWLRDRGTPEPRVTSFGLVSSGMRPSDPIFAYFGRTAIEVRAGLNVEGVTIAMQPASAIEGTVVLSDVKTTVESLQLYLAPLFLEKDTRVWEELLSSMRQARPARNGVFNFPKLPDGHYGFEVVGLPEGAYVADIKQGDTSVYDHGIPLVSQSQKPIEIVIRPSGGTIRGVVLDADGKGVPHAQAVLVPSPSRRTNFMFFKAAEADASGAFTFRGVVPGDYKVFAWEDGPRRIPPPDFFGPYEDRGTPVQAREAETVESVSVRWIPQVP